MDDIKETANFFTAQEVAASVRNIAESAQDKQIFRLRLGIDQIDEVITPMMSGRLYGVLGCTGEAKTYTLNYLSYAATNQIRNQGLTDFVNFHINLEESVEETYADYCKAMGEDIAFASIESGKVNLDVIAKSLAKHASAPICYMGTVLDPHFLTPKGNGDIGFAGVSVKDIYSACVQVKEELNKKPGIIFIDYAQLMRPDVQATEKFIQVEQIIHDCKMMALKLKCPVVVAIQAKQDVKQRKDKIPSIYDAQHSSAIAQTLDGCIALWMPVADYAVGENWQQIKVTPNLIIVHIAKWRKCAGRGRKFALLADFAHNALSYSGTLSAWL